MAEAERLAKGHFFSRGAMDFFNSCMPKYCYKSESGKYLFFITSEQATGMQRRYTVRRLDVKSGMVSSFSEFQQFETRTQAAAWLKETES